MYYRIIQCAPAETRTITAVADEPVKESLTMRAAGTISAILVLIAVALGLYSLVDALGTGLWIFWSSVARGLRRRGADLRAVGGGALVGRSVESKCRA